jgi:hypothetical protein
MSNQTESHTYVTIKLNNNILYHGKVISKVNYGTNELSDWYVEFTDDYKGYCYIKQNQDNLQLATFTFKIGGK